MCYCHPTPRASSALIILTLFCVAWQVTSDSHRTREVGQRQQEKVPGLKEAVAEGKRGQAGEKAPQDGPHVLVGGARWTPKAASTVSNVERRGMLGCCRSSSIMWNRPTGQFSIASETVVADSPAAAPLDPGRPILPAV